MFQSVAVQEEKNQKKLIGQFTPTPLHILTLSLYS